MGSEITALEGDERLESVHYRPRDGGMESLKTHHLFLFIGADPNTNWLRTCGVSLDPGGFVLTDTDLGTRASGPTLPLHTSVDGVFAIGDVRSGSIKRVAGAVGEGAAVVAQIHRFLVMKRAGTPARSMHV